MLAVAVQNAVPGLTLELETLLEMTVEPAIGVGIVRAMHASDPIKGVSLQDRVCAYPQPGPPSASLLTRP